MHLPLGVLLAGLVLDATLGRGWTDPVAGLVIAAVAGREGVEAWCGEGCCAPGHPVEEDDADGCTGACGAG